ncbi:MAG: cell division protein ZipA [Gammaproteobacteria bacterium]|nr:cell division protein ZipA [Gammaproteobacteria bacterium]
MGIESGILFVAIPIILIVVGVWLLRSSYRQPNQTRANNKRRPVRREARQSTNVLASNPLKATTYSAAQIDEKASQIVPDSDSVLGLSPEEAITPAAEPAITPTPVEVPPAPTNTILSANCPDLISLYLVAEKDQPYIGYELLQALLSVGLRYGEMQIFHRYQSKAAKGPVLFSLASAIAPGTFDLPKMGSFSAPALCLVLHPKELAEPAVAYDLMVTTAEQLVDDLGGIILDENRQTLTKDKIAAKRQLLQPQAAPQATENLITESS